MRKTWVILLCVVALSLGGLTGLLALVPGQAASSVAFACRFLNEAEHVGLWSRDKRMAIVDRLGVEFEKQRAAKQGSATDQGQNIKLFLDQLRKDEKDCASFPAEQLPQTGAPSKT